MLSPDQIIAVDLFNEGHNFLLTGPGGSGKSFLIQELKKIAENKDKKIAITALTGCAAVLLNCKATTIHGWAGIGFGDKPIDLICKSIKTKGKYSSYKRWV